MTKSDLDIVEVVQREGVELKFTGKRYFGCCPIHDEKTPSFMVDPCRQRFHCFGCGESGDIIAFIQKKHHVSYPGALKILGLSSGKITPDEMRHIAKQKAVAQKRRAKEQRFKTWQIHYCSQIVKEMDIIEQAAKALTPDNFSIYAGILDDSARLEHEWQTLCFGDRRDRIALYVLRGGKAEKPNQKGFEHKEAV